MLSIIVPTLNEMNTGYLVDILLSYQQIPNCEILCVDGGSQDETCQLIRQSSARLLKTDAVSRAARLNEGIQEARYDLVLLHHPRSIIERQGIEHLIKQGASMNWGAFTHQFDTRHPLLGFTSWYSNFIRGDKRGIYYLDHCIFAQKRLLLDVNMLPDIDIFEDTELCIRLKSNSKSIRLPFVSKTSAIRFKRNGIYRQAIRNQYMKWLYYFNRSDKKMNKIYEQGLELNSRYEQQNPKK